MSQFEVLPDNCTDREIVVVVNKILHGRAICNIVYCVCACVRVCVCVCLGFVRMWPLNMSDDTAGPFDVRCEDKGEVG